MPDPLPADVVGRLRTDSTAALAASLILAGCFPDLVSWALGVFGAKKPTLTLGLAPKGGEPKANGGGNGADRKSNATKARPQSPGSFDQALLGLMRESPGASLSEIIQLAGGRGIRPSRRSSGSRRTGLSSTPGGGSGSHSTTI
jgi:hypothetical protein